MVLSLNSRLEINKEERIGGHRPRLGLSQQWWEPFPACRGGRNTTWM